MNKKVGFIVTKDYVDSIDEGTFIEVSIIGPRGCEVTKEDLLLGEAFKMFDDDKNLYYEGFLVGDSESEEGFLPLECYGEPNAGCSYIQYCRNGVWQTL